MKLMITTLGLLLAVGTQGERIVQIEECCDRKTVGGSNYTKVSTGHVPSDCTNKCIYTKDGEPGTRFCFAVGTETVQCLDSGAASSSDLEARLAALENKVDLKASTTAFNQLTSNVIQHLTELTSNVNSKASTTALNQLTSNVTELTSNVTELTSNVNSKASSTALDPIYGALGSIRRKQALHSAHCGYKGSWSTANQVVTYDKLLTNETGETNSTMDPASGTWTAGLPGTYQITWDLLSIVFPSNLNQLYLHQNGGQVSEGLSQSYLSGNTHGSIQDQGGRSLVLRLVRGDTLSLHSARMDYRVYHITFCVTLLHELNAVIPV